jgi:hypothetical protein
MWVLMRLGRSLDKRDAKGLEAETKRVWQQWGAAGKTPWCVSFWTRISGTRPYRFDKFGFAH